MLKPRVKTCNAVIKNLRQNKSTWSLALKQVREMKYCSDIAPFQISHALTEMVAIMSETWFGDLGKTAEKHGDLNVMLIFLSNLHGYVQIQIKRLHLAGAVTM